ncbi:amino acid ABC transporter permease [Arthrobacter psychrolactophilus]|uniref:Amino acid ABC transporter permease n=1 Tax=Arthrobacter psychrolactophilus TaxID=92442 RepID=A0A2V5IXT9_9MICC|nr:amino acid ABC transporter permease [Arthrobacter psychrolactophilus]PYI39133.1 amino acid ABC transporter permease [Arthrobacter psychrolactophilus]
MMNVELYDRPGPLERRRIRLWTLVLAIPALAGVIWVVTTLREQGILDSEAWSILTDSEVIVSLLTGLLATLKVAGVTVVLSLVVGLLLALGRMSELRWLSLPTRVWVEALRGLPEILLVFLIYLGVPAVTGLNISTFWALVVGLVLYQSASMSEAFRAGFLALPKGQKEAAVALGVRGFKTLRFILLPQVIRQILPNLVSEMVRVTKASSLGFVIGYTELLLSGEQAIEYLGGQYAVPIFAGVALLYVIVCLLLSWVSRILSERLR